MARIRTFAVLLDAIAIACVVDLVALVVLVVFVAAAPQIELTAAGKILIAVWAVIFLLRDVTGGFSRKWLGLRLVRSSGEVPGLWRSVARNLPLLIPGWNLYEAVCVRRGRARSIDTLLGLRFQEVP